MNRQLIVLPPAETDIRSAYQWYEMQREGLGDDFLLATEATLSSIQSRPETFPVVYRAYRRASLFRFPYFVFFAQLHERVYVHAVFHSARAPMSWLDRK